MPYQSPAPRYAKPVPASRLPHPSDPWHVRAVDALRAAAERERDDKMFRIGIALGGLVVAAVIVAQAAA